MTEILLTSERTVKSVTSISDNIAGKYIQSSIREAQDIGLRRIVGDPLLRKVKDLVRTGHIDDPGNEAYKEFIDQAQLYLAYQTVTELVEKVTYKVTNFGVARTTDKNLEAADVDELAKSKYYWQGKADACCIDLQNWLLDNRAGLPELSDRVCHAIQSNLTSAATCGLFLGGARGKIVRRGGR